jgi:sugar phosphate isomerase/epimerase
MGKQEENMLAMTSDFHGESRNSVDIKNTLTRIAQTGFSHVHWCHEWTGSYLYSIHEMLQIKEWCDELGLKVKGVHASIGEKKSDLKDYASFNDYNRLAGVELVRNRVDLAYILNAETIVLHLIMPWEQLEKEEGVLAKHMQNVYRSFDELEPYCKNKRIRLCIENTDGSPGFICGVYDGLFGRYSSDFLGFCFDTGHAILNCNENLLVYAERYNDRIFMIHAHDNCGKTDEHLIPFEGVFDWEGFAPLLAHSPYTMPFLLETAFRGSGDDAPWLVRAFEVGNRLTDMVEKYKPLQTD